jgi:hypothetical protein
MKVDLDDDERRAVTTALLYALEVFKLMPGHWVRLGQICHVESVMARIAPAPRHGQESKLGFPGSRDAYRHISKLLREPRQQREEGS